VVFGIGKSDSGKKKKEKYLLVQQMLEGLIGEYSF
jgi:hypothetical protein